MKHQISNKNFRILYVTLAVILLLGGIKFFQIYSIIQASKGRGAPPATVNTFIVKQENWPETFSGIGSLRAVQGSMLSTQDSGRVASVNFESGQVVEQGQVLVELDSEVEKAQLQAAQAQFKLSELTAKRQRELRAQNANSQADLDLANADLSLANAEIARLQAMIQRRQIVAPFAGRAGVRKLNIGEFVTSGTNVVDVNSSDKFLLDFYLPQKHIGEYKVGDIVEVSVRNIPDQTFVGNLSSINSQIDPTNRNVLMQATVSNLNDVLRPGMFVDLQLIKSVKNEVLVVPLPSVHYAPYGNTIYIIKKETPEPPFQMEAMAVTLGRKRGDFVEVLSGLKLGQEIIASGTFKLFPGVKIFINNEIQPPLSETPQVENN